MRAAIELPGGHLSAPAPYDDSPWDWADITVSDGPIEPNEQSIGWDDRPAGCDAPVELGATRRMTVSDLGAYLVGQDVSGVPRAIQPGAIDTLTVQAGSDAPAPNESYLAKQMQEHLARCLSPMVWELSFGAPNGTGDVVHTPNDWRTDSMVFRWRGTVRGQPYTGASITFTNPRYDPENSDIRYGDKRVAQDVNVQNQGKTKLIKNDSDAPVTVHYEESESLTNSFSTSVTHGLTLDLSVDSTQTISGGYAGVSAEVSMQEHFGVSKTSEETHEQGEEGTHSETISIEFDAAPGQYYLVTLSKEHAITYEPFTIDGVMDFGIEIHWGHEHAGRSSHYRPSGDSVKLDSVAALDQFVHGYDTDYPEMQGAWDHFYSRTKNGIGCVLDPDNRRIQVSGTNQASLESNADYQVESLGHTVPPHLAHLPVDDADDVIGGGGQ